MDAKVSSDEGLVKTTNENLQKALEKWVTMVDAALNEEVGSRRREVATQVFVRTFVPLDVEEEDIAHFSNNLLSDEEFFHSLRRDLNCCATGDLVENIEADQVTKAIFTILPTPGTLSENSTLDIVREVAFISGDRGASWRAEG